MAQQQAVKMTKVFRATIKSVDTEAKTVDTVVSDASMDRYGEVISMDAWKKGVSEYKKHPVLCTSHKYSSLMSQIGLAEKIWEEDNQLCMRFRYFVGEGNPEADWGFKLAQKGIAAFSVGFIAKDWIYPEAAKDQKKGKDVPWRTFTDVELLEVSQVLIPANANARLKKSFENDLDIRELCYEFETKGAELGEDGIEWESSQTPTGKQNILFQKDAGDIEIDEKGKNSTTPGMLESMMEKIDTMCGQMVDMMSMMDDMKKAAPAKPEQLEPEVKNTDGTSGDEETGDPAESGDAGEESADYVKQVLEQIEQTTKMFSVQPDGNEQGDHENTGENQ